MFQIFELFKPLMALFTFLLSHVYTLVVLINPKFGDKINTCFFNAGQKMTRINVYSAEGRHNFRIFYKIFFYLLWGVLFTFLCLRKIDLGNHNLMPSLFIIIIILSFLHESSSLSMGEVIKDLGKTIPYLIVVSLLIFLLNKEFRCLTDLQAVLVGLIIYIISKRKEVMSFVEATFGIIANLLVQLLLRICLALGKERPFDAFMWLVGSFSIPCVIIAFIK